MRRPEKTLPGSDILLAEVEWAVENEMARTVEDFLARRRRALFLDARAAVAMAPTVAERMAKLLGKGRKWRKQQIASFGETAGRFLVT